MLVRKMTQAVLLVVSISSVLLADVAQAQRARGPGGHHGPGGRPGGGYGPGPGRPNPYDPPGSGYPAPGYNQREVKTVYLGRSVYNEMLPLRDLAGIDYRYSGWQVVSVRASTRPNSPNTTTVQLLADGRVVATQVNPGYQINITPAQSLVVDQTVRALHLQINGSTVVDQIQIELVNTQGSGYPQPPPHGPGYPPQPSNPYPPPPQGPGFPPPQPQPPYGNQNITINVNQNLLNNSRIDLNRFVDLRRYAGLAIQQVVIAGQTRSGAAVNMVIDGYVMGQTQFSPGYIQNQFIYLGRGPAVIRGNEVISLYNSGDLFIQQVTLVVTR